MYIVLAAGGTGGHTVPARRLAQQLKERGVETAEMATPGFRSQRRALFLDPWRMIASFIRRRPDYVIGFGSYHSFPALIAATLLGIPFGLVEMNAVMGRVNRLFARRAAWIASGIPLEGACCVAMPMPEAKRGEASDLFVMGGSHGAESIADLLERCDLPDMPITHVTGKGKRAIEGTRVTAYETIADTGPLWARAVIAVTRAGGMTIAEALHYAVPTLLMPYPYARDDHQRKNAIYLESIGGAIVSTGDMERDLARLLEGRESMRARLEEAPKGEPLIDYVMRRAIPETHILGIGGIGMSALAHLMLDRGALISGSDDGKRSERIAELEGRGVEMGTPPKGRRIAYSTAVRDDHPLLRSASHALHRSEVLREQSEGKRVLAVAGTHGKTSTASLLAWTLEVAALSPSFVIGGIPTNFGCNGRYSSGDYIVVEADESDGSFLRLDPVSALITNIEADHLDYWGTYANLEEGFRSFALSVREDLFWCAGDRGAREAALPGTAYGLDTSLPLLGRHMQWNGSGVFALARSLGLEAREIRKAFETFRGVVRRLEHIAALDSVDIYDDYAHHPTEITATLAALREQCKGRLIALFQPHRYTRLRDYFDQFTEAFSDTDEVVITDIYSAGEAPLERVHPLILLSALKTKRARYVPRDRLVPFLMHFVSRGDLVVTLGAGDITEVGRELATRLEKVSG